MVNPSSGPIMLMKFLKIGAFKKAFLKIDSGDRTHHLGYVCASPVPEKDQARSTAFRRNLKSDYFSANWRLVLIDATEML